MITQTTPQHIVAFAEQVRAEDVTEIKNLLGMDPLPALTLGFFSASTCVTGISDKTGQIVMIAGVMPSGTPDVGVVWMICGNDMKAHARTLLVEGSAWLDEQQKVWPVLTNVVEACLKDTRILLKHLGFQFLDPVEGYGPGGVTVIPFERSL